LHHRGSPEALTGLRRKIPREIANIRRPPQDTPPSGAAAITAEGWLHSGDLGAMDERGYLTITGRLKDMIIRGGVNIYPREIEDLLASHPKVAEAAVFGVAHPTWGETVNAAIRPVDPAAPPSPDELRAFCRERLAAFKTPANWFLVDALPATPTGKIQKFVLRDRIDAGELVATPLSTMDARPPSMSS